jgi:YVTN family beta-propeller protein
MLKVYVAVEGEGRIAVIDPLLGKVTGTIDLAETRGGTRHEFAPHNVQVAPDGNSLWVTANHGHGEHEGGHTDGEKIRAWQAVPAAFACHSAQEKGTRQGVMSSKALEPCQEDETTDEVVIIDPRTDRIVRRVAIEIGAHLAHVVVAADGTRAYVTAQAEGAIYIIDAGTFTVVGKIVAPRGSEPHGLRLSPDGSAAFVALFGGKALGILDLAAGTLKTVPLGGAPVQTGVSPDGTLVFASLYDTRQVAVYAVGQGTVSTIDLPPASQGPVQLYPSPDGRMVYVADQGFYSGQPSGQRVYVIDLRARRVVDELRAGAAPHGIVVAPDGGAVYVTNLLSNDVSILDVRSGKEVARIPVGAKPNGISVWDARPRGTP